MLIQKEMIKFDNKIDNIIRLFFKYIYYSVVQKMIKIKFRDLRTNISYYLYSI